MSRRGWLIAGLVVVIGIVGVVGWYVFIRGDAPPPVSLDEAVEQATSTTTTTTAAPTTTVAAQSDAETTTTTSAPATTTTGVVDASADGDWAVTADSFVGYRVREELSGIGATEAVGRTPDVTGTMTVDGSAVLSVAVEADMTTLTSDSSSRDGQLRDRGLETNTFPTASFVLTQPMDLGVTPTVGQSVSAVAVGDLTLHGVTNEIEMPVEAELIDGQTIVAVGSVEIDMRDYDIEPPVGFRVLSIDEIGTIEMQLIFGR